MKSNKNKQNPDDLLNSLFDDVKKDSDSLDAPLNLESPGELTKSQMGVLGTRIQSDEESSGSAGLISFDSVELENDTPNGLLDLSAKPTEIKFGNSRDARTEIFRGGKTEIARAAATIIQPSQNSNSSETNSSQKGTNTDGYGSSIDNQSEIFSTSEVSEYNEKTKVAYDQATQIGGKTEFGTLDLNQGFDKLSAHDPESAGGDNSFYQQQKQQATVVQPSGARSVFDSPGFDQGPVAPVNNGLDELDLSIAKEESLQESPMSSLFGDSPMNQMNGMELPPPVQSSQPVFSENKSDLNNDFSFDLSEKPPAFNPVVASNKPDSLLNEEVNDRTMALSSDQMGSPYSGLNEPSAVVGGAAQSTNMTRVPDSDRTVAVTGFHVKSEPVDHDEKVRVSVGQSNRSSGFSTWNNGVDGQLNQAENLKMAQEKILDLERENEKLRRQNEQLIAASEIMKERADLLTVQLTEFKNDRENLEQSFKNEMTLLKNHITRKDAELGKAQFKVEELESKLKFDMKKIRVRERELENRLELIRAEKNAIVKNKDEQILDLRRKIDILQMEVESYRQKVVELNKQLETSHDSFKRTTRALRLAMANLELHEENKSNLKKAE